MSLVSEPFVVALRANATNRAALAALMAVVEAELPPGLVRMRRFVSWKAYREFAATTGRGHLLV